jgi:cbb3-type cytochrome oxidase subunit 3
MHQCIQYRPYRVYKKKGNQYAAGVIFDLANDIEIMDG